MEMDDPQYRDDQEQDNSSYQNESFALEGPELKMEMMLINEFLRNRGYPSMKDLCNLPEEQAKKIMVEACTYASGKLAEVTSKDRFLKSIHR